MAATPPNSNIDGFIKSINDGIYGVFNKGVKHGRYLALQEQKHGHWVDCYPKDEVAKDMVYACSECNSCVFKNFAPVMKYCPACGAKMDAEVEGC